MYGPRAEIIYTVLGVRYTVGENIRYSNVENSGSPASGSSVSGTSSGSSRSGSPGYSNLKTITV